MLDVKRIRMLREVARLGSFGAAAKELSFTPSAVWQQMAALEREAGTQLFERGPRGARLTHSGQVLLAHAEVALGRLDRAEAELAAIARGEGGQLRFGSFPTATESFVACAVRAFRSRHPGVDLHFRDAEPYEQVVRLERLELDCAVMFDLDSWPAARSYEGEVMSDRDDVIYEDLFEDPYFIALPAGHRLSAHDTVTLSQLAGEVILGSPNECAPWGVDLMQLCEREGFEPRFEPRYHAHDFHSVQALVATGQGLSLLPWLSLGSVRSDILIRRLEPTPTRHVKLGFPPTSYRSAACDALVDILHEVIDRMRERARAGRGATTDDGGGWQSADLAVR
jgi:molybdate transport repressor ModE-like protein